MSSSDSHTSCLICCEPFHPSTLPRAILPCNHNEVCPLCHIRLRVLHNDRQCVICKSSNEGVIVEEGYIEGVSTLSLKETVALPIKLYAEYNTWGNDLGQNYKYHEPSGMFLPLAYYNESILPLFSTVCGCLLEGKGRKKDKCEFVPGGLGGMGIVFEEGIKSKPPPPTSSTTASTTTAEPTPAEDPSKLYSNLKPPTHLKPLLTHMKASHNRTICTLCYINSHTFLSLLPRFSPAELDIHFKKGDSHNGVLSAFNGHPICEFCRPLRVYDLEALHGHLNKEHYKCHICDTLGVRNQFFKDYNKLSQHFSRKHYACMDEGCLRNRFVVFGNVIDYKVHCKEVHGVIDNSSGKIVIDFSVKRSGFTGEGYSDDRSSYTNSRGADFNNGDFPNIGNDANDDSSPFVPDSLPTSNSNGELMQLNEVIITNEFHRDRTAVLRQVARDVRIKQEREDDFPVLEGAGAGGGGGFGGWGGEGSGSGSGSGGGNGNGSAMGNKKKSRDEEYPELGGPTAKSNDQKKQPQHMKANTKLSTSKGMKKNQGKAHDASNFFQVPSDFPQPPSSASSSSASTSSSISSMYASANPPPPTIIKAKPNWTSSGGIGIGRTYEDDEVPLSTLNRNNEPERTSVKVSYKVPDMVQDFPSLGGGGGGSDKKKESMSASVYAKKAPVANVNAGVNTLDVSSFQIPPTSNSSSSTMKKKNDFPDFLASSNSNNPATQLEQLKKHLGPEKYKQLKKLTKDFALSPLSSENYVNQAALLFPSNEGSVFMSLMPVLVSGIPDAMKVAESLSLIDFVGKQMNSLSSSASADGESDEKQSPHPTAAGNVGGWGGSAVRSAPAESTQNNNHVKAPSTFADFAGSAPAIRGRPAAQVGHKSTAWAGSATSANQANVKGKAVNVSLNNDFVPAKNKKESGEVRPTGTAVMAKLAKQERAKEVAAAGGKVGGKKKSQKDEMRALAGFK